MDSILVQRRKLVRWRAEDHPKSAADPLGKGRNARTPMSDLAGGLHAMEAELQYASGRVADEKASYERALVERDACSEKLKAYRVELASMGVELPE